MELSPELIGAGLQAVATIGVGAAAIGIALSEYRSNQAARDRQHDEDNARLKRENTVEIILQMVTSRHLARAALLLDEFGDKESKLHEFEVTNSEEVDVSQFSAEQYNDLFALLGYYEFISQAVAKGELDLDVVRNQRRSRIIRTWKVLSTFIRERRRNLNRPKLYINLQTLAVRFDAELAKENKMSNAIHTLTQQDHDEINGSKA